jgi:hypothetical protein
MRRRMAWAVMLATALGGFAVATPATAQGQPEEDPSRAALERAAELQAQAEALYSQPSKWRQAVRMLEESAELRADGDPARYTSLLFAGRLRAGMGDFAHASRNLEAAASDALARGAVVEAAHAYIDAAHAAVGARRTPDARQFVDRAELLTQSPLLSEVQRAGIRHRLRDTV